MVNMDTRACMFINTIVGYFIHVHVYMYTDMYVIPAYNTYMDITPGFDRCTYTTMVLEKTYMYM